MDDLPLLLRPMSRILGFTSVLKGSLKSRTGETPEQNKVSCSRQLTGRFPQPQMVYNSDAILPYSATCPTNHGEGQQGKIPTLKTALTPSYMLAHGPPSQADSGIQKAEASWSSLPEKELRSSEWSSEDLYTNEVLLVTCWLLSSWA